MWPPRRQPTRLPCPWDSPGKNTGVGCHFLLQCIKVKSESEVTQSCPTLSDPMDCSLPGSSIHGIFQARILEQGAIRPSQYHHRNIFYVLISQKENLGLNYWFDTVQAQKCKCRSWFYFPLTARISKIDWFVSVKFFPIFVFWETLNLQKRWNNCTTDISLFTYFQH